MAGPDDIEVGRDVRDTVHGRRAFEAADPDGNVTCFGMDREQVPRGHAPPYSALRA